jgi:hypothetical protein
MHQITFQAPSEHFGPLRWRYLGTMDIRRLKDQDTWMDKFHPARFFRASYWGIKSEAIVLSGGGHEITVAWAVWVLARSDHHGWKPVPGTPYAAAAGPKSRVVPFGHTDHKIEKWLAASQHLLVPNPGALEQAEAVLAAG